MASVVTVVLKLMLQRRIMGSLITVVLKQLLCYDTIRNTCVKLLKLMFLFVEKDQCWNASSLWQTVLKIRKPNQYHVRLGFILNSHQAPSQTLPIKPQWCWWIERSCWRPVKEKEEGFSDRWTYWQETLFGTRTSQSSGWAQAALTYWQEPTIILVLQ